MKYIAYLLLFISCQAWPKVLIITHNYNCPRFIEVQAKTFKKFLKDDYEYVVFNDANNQNMADQIENMCTTHNVSHVRIPQEIHDRPYQQRDGKYPNSAPHVRHADCVQYSMDTLGFDHDDIILMLDSDMILIHPLSLSDYMKDKDIAAFIRTFRDQVHFLWPGLTILNMKTLPEKRTLCFNTGTINGAPADSGGFTYYYLIKHPELRVVDINTIFSHQLFLGDKHLNRQADNGTDVHETVKMSLYKNNKFTDPEIKFLLKQPDTFEFYLDHCFLHYREGSNYTKQPQNYHDHKFQVFTELLNEIL